MSNKSVTRAKPAEINKGSNTLSVWAKSRIAILDTRLGAGVGAKNERARLAKYIKEESK